jgi:hypothetical protein
MRKRTHLRGFFLGYLAHLVVAMLLAYVGAKASQAISAAYGNESPLRSGPFAPLSLGWAISQPFIFAAAIVGGIAAGYWAPAKSWYAPALIAMVSLALAAPNLPKTGGAAVQALWLLITPVGVLLGAYFHSRVLEPRGTPVEVGGA